VIDDVCVAAKQDELARVGEPGVTFGENLQPFWTFFDEVVVAA
tara:strand:- start:146 stop:274 length:129 start_codon:yes stop_codon:yes gene_type:complete